jgi:hypothetical protein
VPLAENPVTDRSGKTANGKPATPVDTQISVDTGESDASRLPVNTSTLSPHSPLVYNETSGEEEEKIPVMAYQLTDEDPL